MECTRLTRSFAYCLSQQSLSFGLHSPSRTNTIAPTPAFEGNRFLKFNCNGIQHCHAELLDFLHRHQLLVACQQDTKLEVNSSLKEFTDYTILRSDRRHEDGSRLFTLVHHSVPFRVPDVTSSLTMTRQFWQ